MLPIYRSIFHVLLLSNIYNKTARSKNGDVWKRRRHPLKRPAPYAKIYFCVFILRHAGTWPFLAFASCWPPACRPFAKRWMVLPHVKSAREQSSFGGNSLILFKYGNGTVCGCMWKVAANLEAPNYSSIARLYEVCSKSTSTRENCRLLYLPHST